MPPGLNTRCTWGFPLPVTVTVTLVVERAASVPDIGETTTFFVRPGGSRIVQSTDPPEALSVIVPAAGGVTSSVVGLTLSVRVVADADGDGDGDGRVRGGAGLAGRWILPTATPGSGVLRALGVSAAPEPLATGPAPVVPPPAEGAT